MHRDTANVEYETYNYTGNNWSHRNSNKMFKEQVGSLTKKTFNRLTTKDSCTCNITNNTESTEVWNLKPERWGSQLVEEKYRGEKACEKRQQQQQQQQQQHNSPNKQKTKQARLTTKYKTHGSYKFVKKKIRIAFKAGQFWPLLRAPNWRKRHKKFDISKNVISISFCPECRCVFLYNLWYDSPCWIFTAAI